MDNNKPKYDKKKILKILLIVLLCLAIISGVFVISANAYVVNSSEEYIISVSEASKLKDVDCILVLGCGVNADGRPSGMLEDRLKKGIELYDSGVSCKLLMSGDHGQEDYDEVNTMKQFAVKTGIASSDIYMDHAGFSTYESVYRAKEIFQAKKIVIVSQEYHLYRALYIARSLSIEAYGVAAENNTSASGQTVRDIREILARDKDFLTSIFKPEPTYLGEVIPVNGNGDITNDK